MKYSLGNFVWNSVYFENKDSNFGQDAKVDVSGTIREMKQTNKFASKEFNRT